MQKDYKLSIFKIISSLISGLATGCLIYTYSKENEKVNQNQNKKSQNNIISDDIFGVQMIQQKQQVKSQSKSIQNIVVKQGTYVISSCQYTSQNQIKYSRKFLRAGPRESQYYKAQQVKVLIVLNGQICSGLNNILRDLSLYYYQNYSISNVYASKSGFQGIYQQWIHLQANELRFIHQKGGSIIKSRKTKIQYQKLVQYLILKKVNHLLIIGGFQSTNTISLIQQVINSKKCKLGLALIPQFPQFDCKYLPSFGFSTLLQQALRAIQLSYRYSVSHQNGIGIIILPGKNSGRLSLHATLASRKVGACIIPQFITNLQGQNGLLPYIFQRVMKFSFMVLVVSQGCVFSKQNNQISLGYFLNKEIQKYFLKKKITNFNINVTDYSTSMNNLTPIPSDKKFCSMLSLYTIFGLMSGFTNFSISQINQRSSIVPLSLINQLRLINRLDRDWQIMLGTTGQPSFINE